MFSEEKFAERLKKLRTEQNLTLKQLGDAIGVTKGAINNLEKSNKRPGLDVLISLAEFFDVSLDYLVGLDEVKRR